MLNSSEHEICSEHKSQFTNNCKCFLLNIPKHENFSANKYENANHCWHFSYLLAEKISCSAELSMKTFSNLGASHLKFSSRYSKIPY